MTDFHRGPRADAERQLRWTELILPLGIGAALRFALVASFLGVTMAGDENSYLRLGSGWTEFGAYTGFWAPLYPKLVATMHGSFGNDTADAMRVLQVGLAVWTGFWIADMFGGRRAGIGAAWIFSLYLPIAGFCALLYSETLYLALFVPALHQLLVLAREGRGAAPWHRAPLAGALLGLAALTRESTMLFIPPCALWIAIALRGRDGSEDMEQPPRAAWRHRLSTIAVGPALAFALTAALCILPWTIRNAHTYDRFVPIATSTVGSSFVGWNAYDINYDLAGLSESVTAAPGRLRQRIRGEAPDPWASGLETNQADRARANVRRGIAYELEHPAFFARSRLVEFVDLVSPLSFLVRSLRVSPVAAPLATPALRRSVAVLAVLMFPALILLALRGWATARDAGPLRSLAALMMVCTSGVALVNSLTRYRLPLVPVLIVLAAICLFAPRETPPPRRRVAMSCAALLLVLAWIPSAGPVRLALSAIW